MLVLEMFSAVNVISDWWPAQPWPPITPPTTNNKVTDCRSMCQERSSLGNFVYAIVVVKVRKQKQIWVITQGTDIIWDSNIPTPKLEKLGFAKFFQKNIEFKRKRFFFFQIVKRLPDGFETSAQSKCKDVYKCRCSAVCAEQCLLGLVKIFISIM